LLTSQNKTTTTIKFKGFTTVEAGGNGLANLPEI
jgi:hypothetical protein